MQPETGLTAILCSDARRSSPQAGSIGDKQGFRLLVRSYRRLRLL